MLRSLFMSLLLLGLPSVQAEVYTYIDADGNRVFTDRPPGNRSAERVELAPSNSMSSEPTQHYRQLSPPPKPVPRYDRLRILVPDPDATLRNTDQLIVTVTSDPALMPGHLYRLLLDGAEATAPSSSPVMPLQGIERGTHQLAVEIIDSQGRTLERTPSQPFHLRLTTLADKRRITPCKRDDYGVRPECPLKDKPPVKRNIPFVPFL
jgi:hypothetical protein